MLSQLILEELDADTNSVVAETSFVVNDPAAFEKAFDIEITAEPTHESFDLSVEETAQVAMTYRLPLKVKGARGRLCEFRAPESTLPYAIHTGRELLLMVRGEKPFAAFLLDGDLTEEQALSGQAFQRFVDAGRLVRFEAVTSVHGAEMRRLLFALPGEEWRFQAYCVLMDSMREGWDDEKERREGILLGYNDAENDAHIADLLKRKR